ncbi:hypothetical protein CAC42_557 [Sphaceloma murrayae]|uniref:Uncharacterized protein n=1 Tax=Sphaceloma murrayae TaxID=2082308 RepID=A0A2K1R3V2_9PEZI|nr:hypothetical protein CAC42_557 [Sphaceloma murrayae]
MSDPRASLEFTADKTKFIPSDRSRPATREACTEFCFNPGDRPTRVLRSHMAQPKQGKRPNQPPPASEDRVGKLYLWEHGPLKWDWREPVTCYMPESEVRRDQHGRALSPPDLDYPSMGHFAETRWRLDTDRTFRPPHSDTVIEPSEQECFEVRNGILRGRFAGARISKLEDWGRYNRDLHAIEIRPIQYPGSLLEEHKTLYLPAPLEQYFIAYRPNMMHEPWMFLKNTEFNYDQIYMVSMKEREMPTFFFYKARKDLSDGDLLDLRTGWLSRVQDDGEEEYEEITEQEGASNNFTIDQPRRSGRDGQSNNNPAIDQSREFGRDEDDNAAPDDTSGSEMHLERGSSNGDNIYGEDGPGDRRPVQSQPQQMPTSGVPAQPPAQAESQDQIDDLPDYESPSLRGLPRGDYLSHIPPRSLDRTPRGYLPGSQAGYRPTNVAANVAPVAPMSEPRNAPLPIPGLFDSHTSGFLPSSISGPSRNEPSESISGFGFNDVVFGRTTTSVVYEDAISPTSAKPRPQEGAPTEANEGQAIRSIEREEDYVAQTRDDPVDRSGDVGQEEERERSGRSFRESAPVPETTPVAAKRPEALAQDPAAPVAAKRPAPDSGEGAEGPPAKRVKTDPPTTPVGRRTGRIRKVPERYR